MRNLRPLVLGLLLVILSPLGWGEDVYYCVEEHVIELAPTGPGVAYEMKRYIPAKFTFKYEADADRLAVSGWGKNLYHLDCRLVCDASTGMFQAGDRHVSFSLKDGRFNFAASYFSSADAKTGTCTKF